MQIAIGFLACSDGLLADGVHHARRPGRRRDGPCRAASEHGNGTRGSRPAIRRLRGPGLSLHFGLLIATGSGNAVAQLGARGRYLRRIGRARGRVRHCDIRGGRQRGAFPVHDGHRATHRFGDTCRERVACTLGWPSLALVATLGILGSLAGVPMSDRLAAAVIGFMILRMGYKLARGHLEGLVSSPIASRDGGLMRVAGRAVAGELAARPRPSPMSGTSAYEWCLTARMLRLDQESLRNGFELEAISCCPRSLGCQI